MFCNNLTAIESVAYDSPDWHYINKKEAQESVSVTVLLSEASRIAFLCWTATPEAHACVCNQRFRQYSTRDIKPKAR